MKETLPSKLEKEISAQAFTGWLQLIPCIDVAPGSCLRETSFLVLQAALCSSNDKQFKTNGTGWLIAGILVIFYVNYILVFFYLTFKISHFTLSLYLQYQTMIAPKN